MAAARLLTSRPILQSFLVHKTVPVDVVWIRICKSSAVLMKTFHVRVAVMRLVASNRNPNAS